MKNETLSKKIILPGTILSALTVSALLYLQEPHQQTEAAAPQPIEQHSIETPAFETYVTLDTQPEKTSQSGQKTLAKIDPFVDPPKQVVARLESLATQPARLPEFRRQLVLAFTKQNSSQRKKDIIDTAIRSENQQIQDIARSVGFIDQVATNGFRGALESVEETLFPDQDSEDLLDFIADEVAPQNRPDTLEWLQAQGPDLWQDALPLVLGDWAVESPSEVGAWINTLEAGDFRNRAIAEYAPALASQGAGQSKNLVGQITDEDIRQEARIRTGELNFSVLSQ